MKEISLERKERMINSLTCKLPMIRQVMNISQTELGDMVGLSRQSISSIERGTSKLSWNNYMAIMMFIVANLDNYSALLDINDVNEIIDVLNLK